MHLNIILDANALFSFVVSNELWFIGDKFLQDAFAVMMDNKSHFHLLQELEQVRPQFSSTMLMEHILMALIHFLNMHRCIPDVIVIHTGESLFSGIKHQRCNMAEMTAKVKKLCKSVDTHSVRCRAVFYSHMVSLPWYMGWNKESATCRARARLNGAIAKCAQDCGAYVVPHLGIQSVQGEGLYDIHHPGTLLVIGNLIFMSDVVNKVKKIKCLFKVAWQKQQLPGKMFEVAINKSLESRIAPMDIHN